MKIRDILISALGTALFSALVFGAVHTDRVRAATAAPTCVSRQQFLKDFGQAAGVEPLTPAAPDFSDVPTSSPFYAYIEAAYQDHIISGYPDGTFHPTLCLTRAEIAKIEVIALGHAVDASHLQTKQSTFSDNAAIPAWAMGYILEGVRLGLVQGYANGTFRPDSSMTAADEAAFLAQYRVEAAKVAYGSPVQLEMAVWQPISVNGQEQEQIVFTLIDAKGNDVSDFNGTLQVTLSASAGTWLSSGTATATEHFANGEASDYVVFPPAPPANATISPSDLAEPDGAPVPNILYVPFPLTYGTP